MKLFKKTYYNSFRVDINSIGDLERIIDTAKRNNIWLVYDLDREYLEDYEKWDGVCVVFNLYNHLNNSDDYITDVDEIFLYPKIYYCDLNEGEYVSLTLDVFLDLLVNYNRDEKLLEYLNDMKSNLINLIKRYTNLSIGTETLSNIDIEHKFYKHEDFKFRTIKGYSLICDEWHLRTNAGYSEFKTTFNKENKNLKLIT